MSGFRRITTAERTIAPRAVLLIRLSAIGDILFATPLIAALRRAYPQAHIAWLVQSEYQTLLKHHPDLGEVIACPLSKWRQLLRQRRLIAFVREIRDFRKSLGTCRFDMAFDLQGLMKSGLLTRLSDAKERIGLGSREGSQWLMSRVVARGGDSRRIGSEYLYLAETLGLPPDGFEMEVHYGPEDARFAHELIEREGLAGGYAVFCPFTTRPQKHWIESRWVELAAGVRAELGLAPVMLGGPADRHEAARVHGLANGGLANLAGETTLLQAAALIDRAALVVGVDTGLGHMGIAFGRPSLLLFGSTCPYLDTARANARVLYHRLDCSPCKRRPTCDGAFTCMRSIEVAEVLEAAKDLLGRPA